MKRNTRHMRRNAQYICIIYHPTNRNMRRNLCSFSHFAFWIRNGDVMYPYILGAVALLSRMKHYPPLKRGTYLQGTKLYGIDVCESRGISSCVQYFLAPNTWSRLSKMSQSGSSVISRLVDRMSPPRHRSNTEGGLTEEQEDELEHIFKLFDGNRDGLVLKAELEQALRSLGQHPGEEEMAAIFHEHDSHQRGALDFDEFKRLMTARLTYKNTREELAEAFRAIDRNHDGTIDVGELERLMGATGFGLADVNISDIFGEVDKNGSGKIDLEEFVGYMMGT